MAERDGLVEINPCHQIRVPIDGEGERPVRVLTPEECERIVEAAEAHDAKLGRSLAGPLFALLFGAGLRSGEALALRWGREGLDLEAATVCVRASLDRERGPNGDFAEVVPKSLAGFRDVPLAPADAARLRRHRLATGRPRDDDLVFADAGQPLYALGVVRYAWRHAVKAAAVQDPAPPLHDARHAWAVAMLRAGVPPEAVAKLGGWADAGMVYRRYGRHALPDELAGAGEALERYRASRKRG